MNNLKPSCIVAPLTQCNSATNQQPNATIDATDNATTNILWLAERILERNRRNSQCNTPATMDLSDAQTHATKNKSNAHSQSLNDHTGIQTYPMNPSVNSCAVALPKGETLQLIAGSFVANALSLNSTILGMVVASADVAITLSGRRKLMGANPCTPTLGDIVINSAKQIEQKIYNFCSLYTRASWGMEKEVNSGSLLF